MALSKVDVESGGTGLVAAGTSGNVLTSDGTDWTSTAPAGGGAWTVISTAVANNSAVVTITGLNATYDHYAIAISDVRNSDDDKRFEIWRHLRIINAKALRIEHPHLNIAHGLNRCTTNTS